MEVACKGVFGVDLQEEGFSEGRFASFVVGCIFFFGPFSGKGALVCLDIILMKNRFEGLELEN